MDIGQRIAELRTKRGWTTNRLANISGVSQSFLRAVERGEKGISVESLAAVCWALEITLEQFFAQPEGETPEAQLIQQFRQLSPAQQKALLAFLDTLT